MRDVQQLCATNGVCVVVHHASAWVALGLLLLFTLGFYVGRRI